MTTPSVGPVAGTKVFIGASGGQVSPDAASFVEIKDISNIGDIALQYTPITVESIGSGDTTHIKGTRLFPNIDLVLNRNDSDQGQLALKAAANATRGTLYNFKIQETDGGTIVFEGEAFGYGPSYGGVNSLRTVKTSISIKPDTFNWVVGS